MTELIMNMQALKDSISDTDEKSSTTNDKFGYYIRNNDNQNKENRFELEQVEQLLSDYSFKLEKGFEKNQFFY